jgi:hypothetical protein
MDVIAGLVIMYSLMIFPYMLKLLGLGIIADPLIR